MNKSRPTSTLSEKANKPSLQISIPARSNPEESYSEEIAAMRSFPLENISPKDSSNSAVGLDKNVEMAEVSTAISFSESCKFPPTKFNVPTSPPPRAYKWYDSDQSEETSPNLPEALGDTLDSLLDSYLLQDTHAADESPLSSYSPSNEKDEEVSGCWDDGFPAPYGAEDFLECLYDSYLDEDMTSESVDK